MFKIFVNPKFDSGILLTIVEVDVVVPELLLEFVSFDVFVDVLLVKFKSTAFVLLNRENVNKLIISNIIVNISFFNFLPPVFPLICVYIIT